MSQVTLEGMTWSHPRGFDPMVATAAEWRQRSGTMIRWDKRSLQDFESFPVEELARAYDLIVIDHPHVGQITSEACLTPLDGQGHDDALAALSKASIGRSFESYEWQGRQWALPIDAAAQVQVHRPDHLAAPVTRWAEVVALAKEGRVVLPMRPPHSLMCLFTLTANLGRPCASDRGQPFLDAQAGAEALTLLAEITSLIDRADFARDPIAASEALAEDGSPLALMPLGYGYASYARDGFRAHRLAFADIPAAGDQGPRGSALGGTGIAVSAFSRHIPEAIAYACWVAGAEAQAGPYAAAGGQPGHRAAWESDDVNRAVNGFYRATRATLDAAYVRPRHDSYMAFQARASERLNEGLIGGENLKTLIADLNRLFEESF